MGKRKQRKTQETQKQKYSPTIDNQENLQMKVNYQSAQSKGQDTSQKSTESLKGFANDAAKPSGNQHIDKGNSYMTNGQVQEKSINSASQKKKKMQRHQNFLEKEIQTKNGTQQQKTSIQNGTSGPQMERSMKTLLQSHKVLTKNGLSKAPAAKSGYKNEQNSFAQQLENTTRVINSPNNKQQSEYLIEGSLDSDQDDEGYADDEYDDEIINDNFQKNIQMQSANNQNYYYDEVEATQYADNNEAQYVLRNFNSAKNKQLAKDIQQLSIETFIQGDEQIQSDIKFCLYCIYNSHDISQYFKQLLRVQKKLKEWSFQLDPTILFNIFEDSIKEFMHGIRDKLVEEMRQLRMIKQKPTTRRYSFDDYFLIDKTFSRSYSLHGYNNEILNHCMKYMLDSKYEAIRNDLRHRIWTEMRKNNEVIVSFYQQPDSYQKIFDLLIKFYTRVRDSIVGIEEMWIFFMESVFNQELKGNMIFEQFHKQIFKKDILSHRYIQSFLKEINEVQLDLENRRQNKKTHQLDPIIENISQILCELDEDLNFQYPDDTEESQNQQQNQNQQDQLSYEYDVLATNNEEVKEDQDISDSELIITYQQLQEKIKQQYGGQSLAQQVEQYSSHTSNYMNILHSIQRDKRCQDLMKNLSNLDTDTLCYIIENKLSRKESEMILLQNQQKIKQPIESMQREESITNADDVIISPSKNLDFLNHQIYGAEMCFLDKNDSQQSNDEDEDDSKAEKLLEKKKKKNLKKKRKRKEKKILAQHQLQAEEILRLRMLEEQQKRMQYSEEPLRSQLRKRLIEHLGIDQNIKINHSASKQGDYHRSQSENSQQELQTKPTQGDENSSNDDPEIEFERTLELFRMRLEKTNQNLSSKKRRKLVPNIPERWVDQLRDRLKQYYQCDSPRQSLNVRHKEHNKENLSIKHYQRSA